MNIWIVKNNGDGNSFHWSQQISSLTEYELSAYVTLYLYWLMMNLAEGMVGLCQQEYG